MGAGIIGKTFFAMADIEILKCHYITGAYRFMIPIYITFHRDVLK